MPLGGKEGTVNRVIRRRVKRNGTRLLLPVEDQRNHFASSSCFHYSYDRLFPSQDTMPKGTSSHSPYSMALEKVDFDKRKWEADACAFLKMCRETGVPASLERSRSGNWGESVSKTKVETITEEFSPGTHHRGPPSHLNRYEESRISCLTGCAD